jgi:mono/diheme cytochrome c family protein
MRPIRSTTIGLTTVLGIFLVAGTGHADDSGGGGGKVPKPVTGEQVYQAVCQACHMADARGATGAATIPALARDPALASSEYLLTMIANGRGAMPSLTDTLDPAQIAAVSTYIRTHFGNHYPKPVTVADVTAANAKTN